MQHENALVFSQSEAREFFMYIITKLLSSTSVALLVLVIVSLFLLLLSLLLLSLSLKTEHYHCVKNDASYRIFE